MATFCENICDTPDGHKVIVRTCSLNEIHISGFIWEEIASTTERR
jgi:hypothetical protein